MAACKDDAKHTAHNGWIVSEVIVAEGSTGDGLPEVGTMMSAGMRIVTGKGQFLHIQDGSSEVVVSPASTVTISDTAPASKEPDLDLAAGSIQVTPMNGKPVETTVVSAPHVVVVVHGSTVGITATPEQSIVYVSEGLATIGSIPIGDSKTVTGPKMALATQDGIEIK